MAGADASSRERYRFLDHLRFVAVFFMIQGHVFDALLSTQVKSLPLYYLHDFFHGFIAPVFLFVSGASYGVSTIKKWREYIVWGAAPAHRAARYLGLLAIGYALHLPYFSLRAILSITTHAEITAWLQVDALQCIAVTLLVLQLFVLITRRPEVFVRVVAACAVLVVCATPIVWSHHAGAGLPMVCAAYLNADHGSWFPLFPWSAYLLVGAVFGYVIVNARDHQHAVSVMRTTVALSGGVVLMAMLVMWLPVTIYPPHDFWKSDPAIVLIRLGVVTMAAGGMFLASRAARIQPGIPAIVGRESLLVYIVHLQIIYGSVVAPGLGQLIGPTLSVVQTLGVLAVVLIVIMALAVLWHRTKAGYHFVATSVRVAGIASLLFAFVTRPW